MARPRVIIPTRPIYIIPMSRSWESGDRVGVMPVESPTVANADIHSNIAYSKATPSIILSISVPPNTQKTSTIIIVTASSTYL